MTERRRRSVLGDLSWFQVLAGALAAMTSAWIASALGVAGTIIGAAIGSLVVTISSAFYQRGLDRGRTLIVRTEGGTVVETTAEPGETVAALDAVRDATGSQIRGAEVVDEPRGGVRWGVVALTTVLVLAVAGAAMGGYELLTGDSYGARSDNPRLGDPLGDGPTTSTEGPGDGTSPTPTEASSTPTPIPTDSTSPNPSPTPTAPDETVPPGDTTAGQ